MKLYFLSIILLVSSLLGYSQEDTLEINKTKLYTYYAVGVVGYSGTMIGLNELWYKDTKTDKFHFFDDNEGWQQMDKIGHSITSYYMSYGVFKAFESCNISHNKAMWLGAAFSTAFQSTIEIMDGYSDEWGFSWGDVAANTFGTSLFLGQEALWKEQRILMKFSTHTTEFAQYRPELLGSTLPERIFKDYNGQTYWLSGNISSFAKNTKLPAWLNIAVGYGAEGMFQARNLGCHRCTGAVPYRERYRQYFLSLDIDLRKIPTKSKVLNTLFEVIGFIKVPAPTLEFNKNGFKGHFIYF